MKISYQTARTASPQLSNDSYNERQKWTTTIKGEFFILRVLCINCYFTYEKTFI